MQIDVQSKSKSLLGVSDLTLTAPIKRGLIPALDARSYESRLRMLLRTLNTLRVSSLEADPTPLIVDTVDRIRAIHSFRLAIVGEEPFRHLLLAVAFDGGWEQYMRRIWRDLGPLLDVIFSNCDGYLTSHDHGFAEYMGWVRRAQVTTEFFYNASPLTVNDLHYLRETARNQLGAANAPHPTGDPIAQALPALTALYRLTDMYPPREAGLASLLELDDGAILLRAARHLLSDRPEVATALAEAAAEGPNALQAQGRTPVEIAALTWFASDETKQPPETKKPPETQKKAFDASKSQGGIVAAYKDLVYGCLLLIELEEAAAAKALIEASMSAASGGTGSARSPFVNVSFTFQGLRIAEVPPGTLEQLPFEFREGMAARAGILGDLRHNHPTRWTLPERNWPAATPDRVQLTSVHAVVQFACQADPTMEWKDWNEEHPLVPAVRAFENALGGEGVRVLSVQAMQRFVEQLGESSRDHFGFVDGLSQPNVDASDVKGKFSDRVLPGDLLLGYENSLGDKPLTGRLWDDSTFLVVRKLKQDVKALDEALRGVKTEVAKAKMMGRWPDGRNLIDEKDGNEFLYKDDPHGGKCPLQSHIRRANPRSTRPDMKTLPRIMRRGMSYGPRYERDRNDRDAERGIVFMAYCASIAEQFEVIQSWLSGGNSSDPHSYSGLRDAFLGVPQDDDPNTFVYHDGGAEVRVELPSNRPFVQLQWGVYLFVPSKRALEELKQIAHEAANRDEEREEDQRKIERSVLAQKGAAVIGRLRYLEQTMGPEAARTQWKIVLEDVTARMSGTSRVVWAAVREFHQGTLRTPYGVLVCSKELVMQVFENRGNAYYTITGYAKRMDKSFGNIYLGLDDGDAYKAQAEASNRAIQAVTEDQAFEVGRRHTIATIWSLAQDGVEVTVDVKDIVDGVLASVSNEWFGLPDGKFVEGSGWHWRSDKPTCPGHFHSPSRYMFQPNPGTEAAEAGQLHGKALRLAVDAFVKEHRANGTMRHGLLGEALFKAVADDALLASTLIGVMMGFLPTVDGNLRGLLYEWVNDRSLWDHEIAYFADMGDPSLDKARRILLPPLQRTMQLRPVPELVWRTATKAHRLGSVDVVEGDLVVVSIVSATQECLINDDEDLYPIFGGKRAKDKSHPTHACPGYSMAMGVMLGVLAGLLESARFRPTMSPMALRISRR